MSHNVTGPDEKIGRQAIAAFLASFPILGNVFWRPNRINNRADFVEKYGVDIAAQPKQKFVRFLDLQFLRPTDSPIEGFDDCPVLVVTYGIHLFQEFWEVDDDSNSELDFTSAVLLLRDKLLETREFAAGNFLITSEPATFPGVAQFGNDGFTDATGHFIDLNLECSFYDNE